MAVVPFVVALVAAVPIPPGPALELDALCERLLVPAAEATASPAPAAPEPEDDPVAAAERPAVATCVLEARMSLRGRRGSPKSKEARIDASDLGRLTTTPTVEIRRRLGHPTPLPAACPEMFRCVLGARARSAEESRAADALLDPAWKASFDGLCARTWEATALPREELVALVADCDRLLAEIAGLESAEARVHRLRLTSCREFFAYALGLLETAGDGPP
jgi:hypothetical protein